MYDAGFIVVSVTTDLGPTNSGLWSSLNSGINKGQECFFIHPKDPSLKVFVFADPPHLLKLVRNNFLDSRFNFDGVSIGKEYIEKLLLLNKAELNIIHKLDRMRLDANSTERQNVRLAAQLLSEKCAKVILYCGERGYYQCEVEGKSEEYFYDCYEECARVFQLTNDWFDVLNSKTKLNCNDFKCAYGTNLEIQNKVLDDMTEFVTKLRVGNHGTLIPFQKGIILSNKSLKALLPYLQNKYNTSQFRISYILTK